MLADDSAVIRGGLSRVIGADPVIRVVSSVSNGEMAVAAAKRHKPHVVILDIEMPVMDGLTALPLILKENPRTKVIMFSGLTEKGAAVTLKAFSLGAVECIVKPSSAQNVGQGSDFQKQILALIKGLVPEDERIAATDLEPESGMPLQPAQHALPAGVRPLPASKPATPFSLHNDFRSYKGKPSLLAIGSSTGGPQALLTVLKECKGFDIPIVLTQHMPSTFTKILAEHITQHTGVPAAEGVEGEVLQPGRLYVAPGGRHMHLSRREGKVEIHLDDGPPENFCKPAVDPMLRTAIDIYGDRILAVILTGMGTDGLKSGKALVDRGGRMIAQDEASSVVWGMPGAVAQAGLCSQVLPVGEIGPWIRKAVMG
ncbi:MAG: chemotaxis response regulator protein-glutamate methylesterase [Alphaproteobacteria bacterium]|nr:chemotaxis response regulator protein-glutamate methylesterase [Alphaproteobacteria bacterium]